MSHLSPVDAPQVYFEPLDDDDADDRDPSRPSDRLEDLRERFERERGLDCDDRCGDRLERSERFERFEQVERARVEERPGARPLPRL